MSVSPVGRVGPANYFFRPFPGAVQVMRPSGDHEKMEEFIDSESDIDEFSEVKGIFYGDKLKELASFIRMKNFTKLDSITLEARNDRVDEKGLAKRLMPESEKDWDKIVYVIRGGVITSRVLKKISEIKNDEATLGDLALLIKDKILQGNPSYTCEITRKLSVLLNVEYTLNFHKICTLDEVVSIIVQNMFRKNLERIKLAARNFNIEPGLVDHAMNTSQIGFGGQPHDWAKTVYLMPDGIMTNRQIYRIAEFKNDVETLQALAGRIKDKLTHQGSYTFLEMKWSGDMPYILVVRDNPSESF
jgi:hypothetical protein